MSEKNDNRFAQGPIEDTYWSSDKDKKLLNLQKQNKCHENSLMTLLKAKQDIEEENSKLKDKLEQSERNFLKKSKEADNLIGEKQTLEENINQQISQQIRLATTVIELMTENTRKLCEACDMPDSSVQFEEPPNLHNVPGIQTSYQTFSDCMYRIKRRNLRDWNTIKQEALERKAATSQKEMREHSEVSQERLSQVAGAKLVAGNSSIADLGDKYRPTRIAELYLELYDNEWTEAVDTLLNGNRWPEDMIIRHLFIILQGCYKACCQLASQQIQDLVQKLYFDLSSADDTQFVKQHTTELKQLMDARKAIAIDVANVISKDFDRNPTFVEYLRNYEWSDGELVYQITKQTFFEKSISLCWLMAVQDPEMCLDSDVEQKTKFDKDRYKEYTKSGPLFLYSIWPALYLHKNGPLMIKGVAQACG